MIDAEGYISIMSRSDDLINTAGHRLSTGKETLHTKLTPPASPLVQTLTRETYIHRRDRASDNKPSTRSRSERSGDTRRAEGAATLRIRGTIYAGRAPRSSGGRSVCDTGPRPRQGDRAARAGADRRDRDARRRHPGAGRADPEDAVGQDAAPGAARARRERRARGLRQARAVPGYDRGPRRRRGRAAEGRRVLSGQGGGA